MKTVHSAWRDQIGSPGLIANELPRNSDESGDEISECPPDSRAVRVEGPLFTDLLQGLRKAAALHADASTETCSAVINPGKILHQLR